MTSQDSRLEFTQISKELVEFLKDVKFSEGLGFHGDNLDKHLGGSLNEDVLIALLEYRRADMANA